MSDLNKMIDVFESMNGITKDVFQDEVGNFYISLLTARGTSGIIYMYNSKEQFIMMTGIGSKEHETVEEFKKLCGAI